MKKIKAITPCHYGAGNFSFDQLSIAELTTEESIFDKSFFENICPSFSVTLKSPWENSSLIAVFSFS